MKNSDLTRVYGKDNMKNENGFARLNENGELDAPVSSTNIVPPATVPEGKIMASDGDGGTKWVDAEQGGGGTEVIANPTLAGTEDPLNGIEIDGTKYKAIDGVINGLGYLTTAPTSANTDGVKIVVLSEEPATKYDGYLYLITEA